MRLHINFFTSEQGGNKCDDESEGVAALNFEDNTDLGTCISKRMNGEVTGIKCQNMWCKVGIGFFISICQN